MPRRKGARITFDQAQEIRERRALGETTTKLAAEFGVTQQAISMITTGRSHLTPERTEEEKWRVRRGRKLREAYGIDIADLDLMLEKAGHRCEICQLPVDEFTLNARTNRPNIMVDHDHITGKVRGVLCHHCNVLLGYAKDDPSVLRRAADYLEARG